MIAPLKSHTMGAPTRVIIRHREGSGGTGSPLANCVSRSHERQRPQYAAAICAIVRKATSAYCASTGANSTASGWAADCPGHPWRSRARAVAGSRPTDRPRLLALEGAVGGDGPESEGAEAR
jgi:hypothetical protein